MSEETIQELRQLISNKNYFGVEELLESQRLSKEQVEALTELPQLFGGPEVLKKRQKVFPATPKGTGSDPQVTGTVSGGLLLWL